MSPERRLASELYISTSDTRVFDLHSPSGQYTIGRDGHKQMRSGENSMTSIDTFCQMNQLDI
jgi:hypothetical protein